MPHALAARARVEVLVAAFLLSTGGAAIKAAHLDSFQVASWRSGVAAVVLLALQPEARKWSLRSVPAALAYAATLVSFVTANKLTTAAHAIFLQSAAPLYLVVLAPLLLRERFVRRDAYFLALAALGLGLVFADPGRASATAPDPARGNALGVASGVAWALTLAALRSRAQDGNGAATSAVAMGNVLAFVSVFPWALAGPRPTATDLAAVVYLGVFQIALAYRFLTRGLSRVPVVEASLLLLLEPALSPVWAWWLHGERPGWLASLGGLVLLGATTARSVLGSRAEPPGD